MVQGPNPRRTVIFCGKIKTSQRPNAQTQERGPPSDYLLIIWWINLEYIKVTECIIVLVFDLIRLTYFIKWFACYTLNYLHFIKCILLYAFLSIDFNYAFICFYVLKFMYSILCISLYAKLCKPMSFGWWIF